MALQEASCRTARLELHGRRLGLVSLGVTHSSLKTGGRDDWRTPSDLYKALVNRFRFTLDLAADADSSLAETWLGPGSEAEDALEASWLFWASRAGGRALWCNPPYSRSAEFAAKASEESRRSRSLIVMLLAARTDTKAFHAHVMGGAAEIYFIKGRLKFTLPGVPTAAAPFPSMIVVWRPAWGLPPTFGAMGRQGEIL